MVLHQIKKLLHIKRITRIKKQSQNGKETLTNYSTEKELRYRVYNEVKKRKVKRLTVQINGQMNWTVLRRRNSNA
jgi:hypothetical protein